jgi:hypothetical protein
MSPTSLDIERFAFVLAHLEHFSELPPDRVLGALGHTRDELLVSAKAVPERLAEDTKAGSMASAERFVKTHEATRDDLRARRPSLDELDGKPAAKAAIIAIEDEETVAREEASAPAPAVPFRRPAAGEPPPFLVFNAPEPKEQSGETLGVDKAFVAGPGTPFEAARLSAWTIEAYARFVADRRSAPPEVVARLHGHVSEQEEVALLLHFNKRFRAEPGLGDRFEAIVAERIRLNRGTRWSS